MQGMHAGIQLGGGVVNGSCDGASDKSFNGPGCSQIERSRCSSAGAFLRDARAALSTAAGISGKGCYDVILFYAAGGTMDTTARAVAGPAENFSPTALQSGNLVGITAGLLPSASPAETDIIWGYPVTRVGLRPRVPGTLGPSWMTSNP